MKKLYYSISEVSEMLGLAPSNLRFWEKEFKQLRPRRNEGRTRFYSKEDIEIIKQIQYLTNYQNLTLEGARQKLNTKKDEVTKQLEMMERLQRVKKELKGLSKALE